MLYLTVVLGVPMGLIVLLAILAWLPTKDDPEVVSADWLKNNRRRAGRKGWEL